MESMLLEVKTNIDKYGEEEMKYKMETMRGCLDSIREPFTFGRPSCIVLPRKGSIASIQHNVQ